MKNTVKIREKYQVTIPDSVRKKIPLQVGEKVEVLARHGEIVIRPVVEVPREQAWFWTKGWQEQLERSKNDIESGRIKVFKTVKEARKGFGD